MVSSRPGRNTGNTGRSRKKSRAEPGFEFDFLARLFLGGCFRLGGCLFGQHNDCHRRCIARPRPRLEYAQVTTRTILEARPDVAEKLADRFLVTQAIERETRFATLSSLASVISGSTTRRSSLAFGTVVLIVSCFTIELAMLRNMALRCELLRPSRRPGFSYDASVCSSLDSELVLRTQARRRPVIETHTESKAMSLEGLP